MSGQAKTTDELKQSDREKTPQNWRLRRGDSALQSSRCLRRLPAPSSAWLTLGGGFVQSFRRWVWCAEKRRHQGGTETERESFLQAHDSQPGESTKAGRPLVVSGLLHCVGQGLRMQGPQSYAPQLDKVQVSQFKQRPSVPAEPDAAQGTCSSWARGPEMLSHHAVERG